MTITKLAEQLAPEEERSPFSEGQEAPGNPGSDGSRARLRSAYHRLTVADLLEDPPPQDFIVRPYIPAGVAFVLAGPGGSNKTTLTTYLAVCRALGRPMWGSVDVEEGETVILSTEDRLIDYRRKLAALRIDLGDDFDAEAVAERVHFFDLSGVPVRMVENNHGQYYPTTMADDLAAVLADVAPRADLVFMETVSRLAGGVEVNDSLSILVEAAQRVAMLRGVAVGLIHHVSQNAGKEADTSQYAVRGGTALVDNARSVMVLQKLTADSLTLLAPGVEVSAEELERLRVLVHPKSNGALSAQPLFLERASNRHGPVLHPVKLRERATEAQEDRSTAHLASLCAVIERFTEAKENVTERALRGHLTEIGCAEKRLPALILAGIEKGVLMRAPGRTGRGGGKPLTTVQGWRDQLAQAEVGES